MTVALHQRRGRIIHTIPRAAWRKLAVRYCGWGLLLALARERVCVLAGEAASALRELALTGGSPQGAHEEVCAIEQMYLERASDWELLHCRFAAPPICAGY